MESRARAQGVSHPLGLGLFLLTVIQCCAGITLWGCCGTCTCTAVALSWHHGMAGQGFVLQRQSLPAVVSMQCMCWRCRAVAPPECQLHVGAGHMFDATPVLIDCLTD